MIKVSKPLEYASHLLLDFFTVQWASFFSPMQQNKKRKGKSVYAWSTLPESIHGSLPFPESKLSSRPSTSMPSRTQTTNAD